MKTFLSLLSLTMCAAAGSAAAPSQFNLVILASDSSINGSALLATDDNEMDIEGVLQPVMSSNEQPSTFYFDSSTGRLATNSSTSYEERFAYTLYSNYTSSLRFDIPSQKSGGVYYPKFTIADNGSFRAGNLTWGWCPDEENVGDGWYLPGSITLGDIFHGCEAIDGLVAVAA